MITPDKVRTLNAAGQSEQHSPASTSRRRSSLKKPSDRVFGLSKSPAKMPRKSTTFGGEDKQHTYEVEAIPDDNESDTPAMRERRAKRTQACCSVM